MERTKREQALALITCPECGKQISDKAESCIGCGAPITAATLSSAAQVPTKVTFDPRSDLFTGTKPLLAKQCAQAVLDHRWKVDSLDESAGMVSFTTGATWGSFSGVSGSIICVEEGPFQFRLRGSAKQNVRGGQVAAFNLFDEAGKKVQQVIERVKQTSR